MTSPRLCALLVLAAFGLARIPLESRLEGDLRAAGFRGGRLEQGLRDRTGQLGFAVALGGFRSLVASGLHLKVDLAFEEADWEEVSALYEVITRLQPENIGYWDAAHQQLAYNAPAFYRDDAIGLDPGERGRLIRFYHRRGLEFLREGIRRHPEDWYLYFNLGRFLRNRAGDSCGAAVALGEAARRPGAPFYLARFHAYALAECPGREAEAYAVLRRLWDADLGHRKPTARQKLRELEAFLGIPEAQRLP